MAYDTPVASYDNKGLMQNHGIQVGARGYAGKKASMTTTLAGANNDLVVTAKNARLNTDPALYVNYTVLGNNAPAGLYENGYPAQLIPATNLGFQLITTFPGPEGNLFSITLVDPHVVASLEIEVPALNSIVVRLARSASALTTTPAALVAALNANPAVSRYVRAYISDSSVVAALPAMGPIFFKGGSDVPGLILVSLANTDGTVTATGAQVAALLNGSRYVKAVNSGSDTGAGTVTVLATTALVGGTPSRGDIAEESDSRNAFNRLVRRRGQPIGKETNRTLEVESGRIGFLRNLVPVPMNDRAIVNSSQVNYQQERSPAKMRWF